MLDYEPNAKIINYILNDKWQGMARNIGLMDVSFFLPMKKQSLFSNTFDGLTCGYVILKRGFDKEKNKNYEYTINLGRFGVKDGQPRFGKNIWKSGGVTLDEDYMDAMAELFVQEDGSISGMFPVFTARKKKKTEMVGIIRASEGASLGSTSKPMGDFVALRDGDEEEKELFILRVNSCF